jgi:hypothetical protein
MRVHNVTRRRLYRTGFTSSSPVLPAVPFPACTARLRSLALRARASRCGCSLRPPSAAHARRSMRPAALAGAAAAVHAEKDALRRAMRATLRSLPAEALERESA